MNFRVLGPIRAWRGSWVVQHEVQTAALTAAEMLGDRHAMAYTQRSLGLSRPWRRALEVLEEIGHPDADLVRNKVREVSPD
nr:hypothetical protein [uncultured Actinoplanes sp.]